MITIITPTHDTTWLEETLRSLEAQTYEGESEWLVVPNNGVTLSEAVIAKARIVPYEDEVTSVGKLKRFACENVDPNTEVIVELDHDDLLTPHALEAVAIAFSDPSVDFAYSNFAEFKDNSWQPYKKYLPGYGWMTRTAHYYAHNFREYRAFKVDARSMSLIFYAPNHVRAWRPEAYWDVGGHDESMQVCDDHDLVCRFYLEKKMKHIDECLYLYRVHGGNTWLKRNKAIQVATKKVRTKYLYRMAIRQAELAGLPKVDLGSAHGKPDGFIGVDQYAGPSVDRVCDVSGGLPFEDNSVGLVRAMDFLEHIPDSVGLMNEIWRVLADGMFLVSGTPSTDGRGAWQDPTHVSGWNNNSFWYYTNREYAKYVPEIKCRFQSMRVETYFPSDFHRRHDIPYVYADLAAIKSDARRPARTLI